eukprot:g4916.t1
MVWNEYLHRPKVVSTYSNALTRFEIAYEATRSGSIINDFKVDDEDPSSKKNPLQHHKETVSSLRTNFQSYESSLKALRKEIECLHLENQKIRASYATIQRVTEQRILEEWQLRTKAEKALFDAKQTDTATSEEPSSSEKGCISDVDYSQISSISKDSIQKINEVNEINDLMKKKEEQYKRQIDNLHELIETTIEERKSITLKYEASERERIEKVNALKVIDENHILEINDLQSEVSRLREEAVTSQMLWERKVEEVKNECFAVKEEKNETDLRNKDLEALIVKLKIKLEKAKAHIKEVEAQNSAVMKSPVRSLGRSAVTFASSDHSTRETKISRLEAQRRHALSSTRDSEVTESKVDRKLKEMEAREKEKKKIVNVDTPVEKEKVKRRKKKARSKIKKLQDEDQENTVIAEVRRNIMRDRRSAGWASDESGRDSVASAGTRSVEFSDDENIIMTKYSEEVAKARTPFEKAFRLLQKEILESAGDSFNFERSFDIFDHQREGVIILSDFASVLQELNITNDLTVDEVAHLLTLVDDTDQGFISVNELSRFAKLESIPTKLEMKNPKKKRRKRRKKIN